ncbi:hypothetical protein HW561_00125 [Rhodobacteraceae bacterium B1Z28]|uniref:Uncharacterized protein n=1 Tax=Ruegeria haliotis TaxID=2747601 RepID=A0ABX2PLM7_9RHOB|nr:hypothetical protein [Ruegeria haliotis]NVO54197.1 hypothetical protein [Ruegeria haliotis]
MYFKSILKRLLGEKTVLISIPEAIDLDSVNDSHPDMAERSEFRDLFQSMLAEKQNDVSLRRARDK